MIALNGIANVKQFHSRCVTIIHGMYVTSHQSQLSLAIPSWVSAISTSQRAVMTCGWKYRQGMVRVRVAGKTV